MNAVSRQTLRGIGSKENGFPVKWKSCELGKKFTLDMCEARDQDTVDDHVARSRQGGINTVVMKRSIYNLGFVHATEHIRLVEVASDKVTSFHIGSEDSALLRRPTIDKVICCSRRVAFLSKVSSTQGEN